MKAVLQIRPYKSEDPTEVLDLIEPQEDGFWLLQGLLTNESSNELLNLLKILDREDTQMTRDHRFDDAYGLSLIFCKDESVEIHHTYIENFTFILTFRNLKKIIHAILSYRNEGVANTVELFLSAREGPRIK